MSASDFIVKLADALQTETRLEPETKLDDLDEYDSLARMSILALMDQDYGVELSLEDFKAIKTVADLLAKVGL
ncbi:MAG: acyl carrier protein [Helicobacteraceae bacterium]|jgi:acyl carrier protein|nr:acyl carrier protein [Helicobacteraceae bacterium]